MLRRYQIVGSMQPHRRIPNTKNVKLKFYEFLATTMDKIGEIKNE